MHYAENSPIKPLVVRSEDSDEGDALPQSVAMFRPGLVDAVARYPLLQRFPTGVNRDSQGAPAERV